MDDESLDLATLDYLPRDKRIKRLRPCCTAFNPCQQCSKIRPEERILEDAEYSMIQRRILADQMKKDRLNNLQVLNNNCADNLTANGDSSKDSQEKEDSANADSAANEKGKAARTRLEQLREEVWGADYQRPTTASLKKSMETFLQDGPCADVAPKLNKCRECKIAANQRSKPRGIFCRFFAFRCLRYSNKGVLQSNGFLLPEQATDADEAPWLPTPTADVELTPKDLAKRWNAETAVYILANVGDQFCELKEQEMYAKSLLPPDTLVAWKKPVQGVREMCDVCETTIFNFHWVCHRCGFVVCIDCNKRRVSTDVKEEVEEETVTRRAEAAASVEDVSEEKDKFRWLFCSQNNRGHAPERLVPTVIIPADALQKLSDEIHRTRERWRIRSQCPCFDSKTNKNKENQAPDGVRVVKDETLAAPVLHPLYKPGIKLNGVVMDDHAYGKPPKGTRRPPTPPASTSDLVQGALIAAPHLRDDPSPLFLLADAALAGEEDKSMDEEMQVSSTTDDNTLSSTSHVETCDAQKNHDDALCTRCDVTSTNGDEPPPKTVSSKPGSTLRELLTRTKPKRPLSPSVITSSVPHEVTRGATPDGAVDAIALKRARLSRPGRCTAVGSLDDLISSVVEQNSNPQSMSPRIPLTRPLKYYVPRYTPSTSGRDSPIRIHSLTETKFIYPDVPHSWLCDGRLLRIHDPDHPDNGKLFQEQWKRGQPVVVSNIHKSLTPKVWDPEAFCDEFGHIKNDLVNCRNGHIMHALPMKEFWDGFANLKKRLVDQFQNPLVLKLKDWPPTEDFAELMPARFGDLMRVLPMAAYTHRDGILNLAGRLPDFCVKPDLGPKMYNAYGMARYPQCGTTNLHLDMSDAVNVMVYIGKAGEEETIYKTIEEAGVDIMTKRRLAEGREDGAALPGALWHIFDACDSDAIRDLLNKVAEEIGEPVEADHDPIHDQAWYLDAVLRDRLHKEYGVTGYAIVQCLGDSVFIPAGAPHQVLNLNSCIKAAEDFVSPEHVSHCFRLTQEFRHLSDTHTNHEDKLQVKNIIYHAVKDAVSVLLTADLGHELLPNGEEKET